LPEYFENVLQELRQGKLILSNLRKWINGRSKTTKVFSK
jgi:hypothetical protein